MTQQETKAVEEFAKASTETKQLIISNSLSAEIKAYNDGKYLGIKLGAEFLDDLRKPSEPETNVGEAGEELVEKIELILNENRETDKFNRTALDWRNFHSVATEIAALMQPDKELLEALKKICRVASSYIKYYDDELDNAICEAMLAVYNYEKQSK